MQEMDTGSSGNLMPFDIFQILFPMITTVKLNEIQKRSVILRTYNKASFTHLGNEACKLNTETNG